MSRMCSLAGRAALLAYLAGAAGCSGSVESVGPGKTGTMAVKNGMTGRAGTLANGTGGSKASTQDAAAAAGSGGTSTSASGGQGAGGGGAAGRGGSGGSGGRGSGGSMAVIPSKLGDPGCGLDAAAFCDNFNAPSKTRAREGDLDPARWSAARNCPQLATAHGVAIAAGPATLPQCRADLPAKVFPDDDTLVCDAIDTIHSNHLLVAVGTQNYGENSYRIRQPFDFSGRTGKIVFDAQGFLINPLLGWISIEVTEDPTPIPSYSIGSPDQTNNEGGAVPRNAFELQFSDNCGGRKPAAFGLTLLDVIEAYKDSVIMPDKEVCLPAAEGKLNHFEIRVSQSRIEVYGSPASDDGVTFEPGQLLLGADVQLPFTHGYVHITTHNHATLKYSGPGKGYGADQTMDALISRWDNVGFDGPVFENWREYEIPDSLIAGQDGWSISGPVMSTAYTVADAAKGPKDTFHFKGVDLTGVQSAAIAIASWYDLTNTQIENAILQYRLNGGAWHDRRLTTDEVTVMKNGHALGSMAQMLDAPLSDLVAGDNTLEFQSVNVAQGYPPAVWGIDLVLTTK